MNWKKVVEIILAVLTFGLSLLKKKESEECTDLDCECPCHIGSEDFQEEEEEKKKVLTSEQTGIVNLPVIQMLVIRNKNKKNKPKPKRKHYYIKRKKR